MDEMDVEPVDLRDELGELFHPGLEVAPVVISGPVVDELLHPCQLYALGAIVDGLLVGPARVCDANTQRIEFRLRYFDGEGPDRFITG
jgi:hypothetical protein